MPGLWAIVPRSDNGSRVAPSSTSTPMRFSGTSTRAMGRFESEASPMKVVSMS